MTGKAGSISLITLVQVSLLITQTGKICGYFYLKMNQFIHISELHFIVMIRRGVRWVELSLCQGTRWRSLTAGVELLLVSVALSNLENFYSGEG